jgi:MYXO-CTERM domain-containing protein
MICGCAADDDDDAGGELGFVVVVVVRSLVRQRFGDHAPLSAAAAAVEEGEGGKMEA